MRANGAGKAVAIRRCISKIIFIFVGHIISIRREHERRSAGPTADKLSAKAFACDRITLAKSGSGLRIALNGTWEQLFLQIFANFVSQTSYLISEG
jgi:hypothetical protein